MSSFPGFIDLQVNGCAGFDVNNPEELSVENIFKMTEYQWRQGVIRWFPTIISNSDEAIKHILRVIAEARKKDSLIEYSIPGVHLEIYVAEEAKGVHNPDYLRYPKWEFIQRLPSELKEIVKIITLAPELPNATRFIKAARERGIVIALGHTLANQEIIIKACLSGATLSTHLGNGIPQKIDRHQNPIIFQLANRSLSASFIADGYHVDLNILKTFIQMKGVSRSIIVTDSISAAGCPGGEYRLVDVKIIVRNGASYFVGTPYLAGSVTTMIKEFENLIYLCGFSWPEAITMTFINPMNLMKLKMSSLVYCNFGKDHGLKIKSVKIKGKKVF